MFYNIKEVEAQGSKATGVHPMQIKDLLQSLVDDGLVNAEKCGVTTLYWYFEYDKHKKMKVLVEKSQEKLDKLKKDVDVASQRIDAEKKLRSKGNAEELIKRIEVLKLEKRELTGKLSSFAFGVDKVESIKKDLKVQISNGEICADNIESLIYYFNKNNGISRDVFKQELGIPEEFKDYPSIDELFANLT